jgi:hypothetical protein
MALFIDETETQSISLIYVVFDSTLFSGDSHEKITLDDSSSQHGRCGNRAIHGQYR